MKVIHFGHVPILRGHPEYGCTNEHPGRWVLNLVRAESEYANLDVEIFTYAPPGSKGCRLSLDDIAIEYVEGQRRFRAVTNYMLDRMRFAKKARRVQTASMIHAHGYESIYAISAIQTGIPFVVTAQGMRFMQRKHVRLTGGLLFLLLRYQEHCALKRTRYVIAKSDNVASALRQAYPHLTIFRISNTFDTALLNVCKTRQKETIAFVGDLTYRKGLHILRKAISIAMREYPSIRFVIIGNSDEQMGEYAGKELHKLREMLGSRLRLVGRVHPLKVAEEVARSTILVAPSIEEMFGNQLIEALLVGTHGIVTDNTALAENVRRFGNGTIVPQEDPVSLAAAIVKALGMPEFSESAEARRRIISLMGPANIALKHKEVYETILQESRRSKKH